MTWFIYTRIVDRFSLTEPFPEHLREVMNSMMYNLKLGDSLTFTMKIIDKIFKMQAMTRYINMKLGNSSSLTNHFSEQSPSYEAANVVANVCLLQFARCTQGLERT